MKDVQKKCVHSPSLCSKPIKTKEVIDDFLIEVLKLELDQGEAEVIALAKLEDAEKIIID